MGISVYTKKTTELSEKEISDIYDLFFLVFKKHRPTSLFRRQFENTSRNYSYHAIAKDGDKIIGHNVYLPFDYTFSGKKRCIALSVDAMVHPDYRGRGIYEKLASTCEEAAKEDGCSFRLGFPNENSYPIQMRKFHYTHIGELSTYCLPIKVSVLNSSLRYFDWLSSSMAKLLISLSNLQFDSNIISANILPKRPEFDSHRFNWFNGEYQTIDNGNYKATYKIDNFKGIKAAFILDVFPLSKKNFEDAVRHIYRKVKSQVPFILYVGNLPFRPYSMIKIPEKESPKHFHVVGKALSDELHKSEWDHLNNWSLNLASFDLL